MHSNGERSKEEMLVEHLRDNLPVWKDWLELLWSRHKEDPEVRARYEGELNMLKIIEALIDGDLE